MTSIFWQRRAELWPNHLPGGMRLPPEKHELPIDYEVKSLLESCRRSELQKRASLAREFDCKFLAPIVGDDFSPFREVRQFWIPLAAAFAHREANAQQKRVLAMKTKASALLMFLQRLETVNLTANKAMLHEVARMWVDSPLSMLHKQPLRILLAGEGLNDELRYAVEDAQQVLAELKGLKRLAHRNTIFAARAFAAIMGLAWTRITMLPLSETSLHNFASAAWQSLGHDDNQMENACAKVFASTPDWMKSLEAREFLNLTAKTWEEDIFLNPPMGGYNWNDLLLDFDKYILSGS